MTDPTTGDHIWYAVLQLLSEQESLTVADERWLEGRVLNACAGKTRLSHSKEVVRNDINPEREADHHIDVRAIDDLFPLDSFDTVVFDPPFDQTQADDHYGGMHDRERGPARRTLAALVRPGGIFIECGWNDHGPALADDCWRREECHRYRRGPSYQPMFLTVDRRNSRQMTLRHLTS